MCKLTLYKKWWIIKQDDKPVMFGIGSPTQALAIAKANDVIVTEFKDLNSRRAA